MMTPCDDIKLDTITRSKLFCVKITVLTGIDIDLDPDCHNHYLGSQYYALLLVESSKVTAHHL